MNNPEKVKPITKEQEIKCLQELLNSSSYLRDSLGIEGIETMIQNIKNDFPIGIGVFVLFEDHQLTEKSYDDKIQRMEQEIADLKIHYYNKLSTQKRFRNDILESILSDEYTGNVKYSIEFVKSNYTPEEITFSRIKQGIAIQDNEEDMKIVEEAFKLLNEKRQQG